MLDDPLKDRGNNRLPRRLKVAGVCGIAFCIELVEMVEALGLEIGEWLRGSLKSR
jgi:hypothetical protein